LTAVSLLELARRDGVHVSEAANGRLKATGPSHALRRWLPKLKAAKPSILSAMASDKPEGLQTPAAVATLRQGSRSHVAGATASNNWRSRLHELSSTPCPEGFSPKRWAILLEGAERFAQQWAGKAMGLGWTFEELFALREPLANLSLQGAVWFVGDSTATVVTADAITLRTEHGATQRIYRKPGA
jgi:hypothetical protein